MKAAILNLKRILLAFPDCGGAAGLDDLLQPVGQPLAQGQLLQVLPPIEQVHAATAVQGLDGKL